MGDDRRVRGSLVATMSGTTSILNFAFFTMARKDSIIGWSNVACWRPMRITGRSASIFGGMGGVSA